MIAPLDLTTEQLEIYKLLYSKMNFDDYLVKYTLEQLATDSNPILLLTKKKVNRIIKNFIVENFLTVITTGSKGNPTIYKVSKIKVLFEEHKGNTKETQRELKGNLKGTNETSDTNALECVEEHKGNLKGTQRELKGNLKVTPINDKDKEKDKYIDIFNYYISLDIIKHSTFTPAMKKAIELAIKQNSYSVDDCKELLRKHKEVSVKSKGGKFEVKKRPLAEFFGQKIKDSTSLICTQYEDGGKYDFMVDKVIVSNPNKPKIIKREEY